MCPQWKGVTSHLWRSGGGAAALFELLEKDTTDDDVIRLLEGGGEDYSHAVRLGLYINTLALSVVNHRAFYFTPRCLQNKTNHSRLRIHISSGGRIIGGAHFAFRQKNMQPKIHTLPLRGRFSIA